MILLQFIMITNFLNLEIYYDYISVKVKWNKT